LPLKWITSLDHKLDMATSPARASDLLGLRRYAAICGQGVAPGMV
jgi:hypothetical protein